VHVEERQPIIATSAISGPRSEHRMTLSQRISRKWWIRLGVPAVLIAVGGIATNLLHRHSNTETLSAEANQYPIEQKSGLNKPTVVTVQPVVAQSVQRKVHVVGTMNGREEIIVTAKVDGRISRIYYDLGDEVKPNDILLEIDDTDYKLAVAEARRNFELELTKLGLDHLPSEEFDITQLPMVVKAAALVRSSQAHLERVKQARASGVGAEEDVSLAEAEHKVARANYQQALLDARTTLAAVHQRKAVLDIALQRLADTKLLVPVVSDRPLSVVGPGGQPVQLPPVSRFSVSRRMVSEGEMLRVSPTTSMSVFKLVADDYLKLAATVPERYLNEVKIGQEVELEVEAHRDQLFRGLVIRMNPTVEPASRTFQILIGVPNPERKLRAGLFAKAAISTRLDSGALTVPAEALVSFAGVTKVFVVEGGLAKEVHVTPGVRLNVQHGGRKSAWVEVSGNLKAGQSVVTSGQTQLFDGKPVRIREGH
jgi:multidrug efflux pump subunit AcrA (membrane-fusion protein)